MEYVDLVIDRVIKTGKSEVIDTSDKEVRNYVAERLETLGYKKVVYICMWNKLAAITVDGDYKKAFHDNGFVTYRE